MFIRPNADSPVMIRITAIARGRVQGIGYRYFVTGCAHETGVIGYVRNQPDGTVQIVAEGTRENLNLFTRLIRADQDPSILVENLDITPGEATGEFTQFAIQW
jgi:acylphosphatase